MKVKVKKVLEGGKHLSTEDVKKSAPFIGLLRMGESKSRRLGRTVAVAALFDEKQVGSVEIIEPLQDAVVTAIDGKMMRIRGIEERAGVSSYQVWHVEVL